MRRPSGLTCGLAGAVVVLVAAAGAGSYLGTRSARGPYATHRTTSTPAAPSQLALATRVPSTAATTTAPAPIARSVAGRLKSALAASGLGGSVRARVLDAATGRVLLDRGGSVPVPPASTAKLFTAVAVLSLRRPTDRITTTAVTDGRGTLALVGAGDPTLTAAAAGKPGAYREAARLSDLAAQVRRAHVRVTRIVVDDSRFAGPSVSPDWADEDVPSDYASAITAVLADAGRASPGATERSVTPDLDAGRSFAARLGRPTLPVARGQVRQPNPQVVGTVKSAPLGLLVEQMLQFSDNVIAECLARQVAVAGGEPVSFTGAATAVRAAARAAGVDPGPGLVDGSGLAPRDRVSTATLAAALRLVTADRHDRLRSVAAGLPVAGWSGTLADRYLAASSSAAGIVRAKTGTLTGVSALAGLVHDRDGRLVVFAMVADRTRSTPAAQAALDAVAARLAGCGCS